MNEETHAQLYSEVFLQECNIGSQPYIYELLEHIHPPIATILLNMLHFNPHDRPCIDELCDTEYASALEPFDGVDGVSSASKTNSKAYDKHGITNTDAKSFWSHADYQLECAGHNQQTEQAYCLDENSSSKYGDDVVPDYNTPCIMNSRRVRGNPAVLNKRQTGGAEESKQSWLLSPNDADIPLTSNPVLKSQIDVISRLEKTIHQKITEADE